MQALIKLATILAAASVIGCSTLDVHTGNGNGNGGYGGEDVLQQMAADSQAGGE